MKDIINSFKAHLYERTSSPLIGTFIFYWIICNYKLIMIIFDGEMKLNEKFDLIKTIYPQEKITLWNGFDIYYQILLGNGLLIPLIITLIYILLLPYASNYIYSLWIKHQNDLKKRSNEKVLTKKEFGDLQRRFTELELSFDDTFSKKDNEITQLKKILIEKDEYNLKLEKEINLLKDTYVIQKEEHKLIEKLEIEENENEQENNLGFSKIEIEILKLIGNSNGLYISSIQKQKGLHKIKVESACKKLNENNLIKEYEFQGKYIATEKGKKFLLDNNLI
ncbi:hypothetical protein [Aliarcobacter butzleri]|uniref:hypothetical protein n=1 Tax=Aliarcobacter butzleri TaxID=28197 RepID=UPI0021B312A5|nr:hypothetical protein [Aliarcobacter butzleri]MCT7577076.1 hypothetical protein [Aliarcobacter butzleri]